jgi:hypothetical protein
MSFKEGTFISKRLKSLKTKKQSKPPFDLKFMGFLNDQNDFPISTQVSRLLNFLVTTFPNSKPNLMIADMFPPSFTQNKE